MFVSWEDCDSADVPMDPVRGHVTDNSICKNLVLFRLCKMIFLFLL